MLFEPPPVRLAVSIVFNVSVPKPVATSDVFVSVMSASRVTTSESVPLPPVNDAVPDQSPIVNELFVGETPPGSSRDQRRMYLDELDETAQRAVVDFFTANNDEIISELLAGNGLHATNWMMVTYRPKPPTRSASEGEGEGEATNKPKWIIRSSADAIKFYSDGPVELTKFGNLKIGRITMQRKGGDNGRETAKMLQFKINPVQLFDAK